MAASCTATSPMSHVAALASGMGTGMMCSRWICSCTGGTQAAVLNDRSGRWGRAAHSCISLAGVHRAEQCNRAKGATAADGAARRAAAAPAPSACSLEAHSAAAHLISLLVHIVNGPLQHRLADLQGRRLTAAQGAGSMQRRSVPTNRAAAGRQVAAAREVRLQQGACGPPTRRRSWPRSLSSAPRPWFARLQVFSWRKSPSPIAAHVAIVHGKE